MKFLPLILLGAALCLPAAAQHHASGDTDDSGVLPSQQARAEMVLGVYLLPECSIVQTVFGPVVVDREVALALSDNPLPDYTETWTSGGSTCTMNFWKKTSESPSDFTKRVDCAVKEMQKTKPKDPPQTSMSAPARLSLPERAELTRAA